MRMFRVLCMIFYCTLVACVAPKVYSQTTVSPTSTASGWHLPRTGFADDQIYFTNPKSDSNTISLVPTGLPSLRRIGFIEFENFGSNVPNDAVITSASLNLSRLTSPAGTLIEVDRITQDRSSWYGSFTLPVPRTGIPISGTIVPDSTWINVFPIISYWHSHRTPNENFGISLRKTGTDGNSPLLRSSQSLTPPTLDVSFYAPPRVNFVVFGDGSSQRSMVKKIEMHFSTITEIDPNAFKLDISTTPGPNFSPVTFTVNQSHSTSSGKSVVTFTFGGTEGDSLPDGNFRVTAFSTKIRGLASNGGLPLNGDYDSTPGGDFVGGGIDTDNYFRRYGDSSGNRVTSLAELGQLRAAINKASPDPGYDARFDLDSNGVVTLRELGQLRVRINIPLGF